MRNLIGGDAGRARTSVGSTRTWGSQVLSPALAALFSLMIIPAWLDALSQVSAERRTLSAFIAIAYSLACVVAVPVVRRASRHTQMIACLTLLALGAAFVALTGVTNSAVLVCALCVVATLMPQGVTAAVTLVTVSGLSVSALYAGSFSAQFSKLVILASTTAAVALLVRLLDANAELRRARDQIALFAVAKERERFARDLHDILGHSLTTIAVKAGLARRVLESGNLDRSMTEIREVERLARQALTDMRGTVSDYRDITLAGELAAANQTLHAAGIEADLPYAVDDVAPRLQAVFGYVLREAVTNVVRHSEAQKVSVRLGRDWITVTDDGRGCGSNAAGNGLNGLRERLGNVNGTLEACPTQPAGFVVRASAPADIDSGGPA